MVIERRKRLLKLLADRSPLTVDELVVHLESSAATVRRDISWLATRKLLTRRRGAVELASETAQPVTADTPTFQSNFLHNTDKKRAIARRAAEMCNDGDTIVINAGSTTFMMADFLSDKRLTILTNSFMTAQRLLATSESDVIIPGGKIYREHNVILSPFDNDVTEHHYASRMFMSAFGISLLGLIEAEALLIQAEKRLINQAEKLVVLVDSAKFARRAGLILCGLHHIDTVITDTDVSDSAVQWLEQAGIHVIVVPPERRP